MRLAPAVLYLFFSSAALAPAAEPRKLVVVAIDGLDARYLRDADRLHLKIPVLRKLVRQGASATGVIGVVPNDSWAANTTLITGVRPAVHAVVTNEDPLQASKVLTLWEAAQDAHRKAALLFWPASVGAAAEWNCPQFWEGRRAVDLPFDPIEGKCTPGLVRRISQKFPDFTKAQWNDNTALTGLRYLLQYEQPDLTLVHLTDLDGEERETGALSVYSRDVLENDDDLLGQALAKAGPRTVVAIVSDHGFDTERFLIRPKVMAGSAAIEIRYGLIGATDQKAAAALRRLLANKKSGIARELPVAEVSRLGFQVSGWVAAFATAPGYIASESNKGPAVGQGSHRGISELWPTRQDFRSVFVLSGGGVKPGSLGEVSMLSIAPTFADILGLKLAAPGISLWSKLVK